MSINQDPSTIVKAAQCYHCGDPCREAAVVEDGHSFCCNGCRSVYGILNECSLGDYYTLEEHPGSRPKDLAEFDYLELEEVRRSIVQYEDDQVYKIRLFIPEIHCSSCIYLLEKLCVVEPAVISSRVDFHRKELSMTVRKEPEVLQRIFHVVQRLGYTPLLPEEAGAGQQKESRNLLVRIGITGFCFGNIMLLSFPEYVSGTGAVEAGWEKLFNALIIGLMVPALWFGARDYFRTALKNLRAGFLSVDVPIVLGISALTIRSIYEIAYLGQPGYFDSLAGFLFFLLIGKWFQSRTYEHLSFDKDVNSFLPLAILRKNADGYAPVRVKELKAGDMIRLRHREVLPVNARLLDPAAEFDYSFVTGEADLVKKSEKDLLFAGGRLMSPAVLLMVTDAADQSYLQQLWKNQDEKYSAQPLTSLIDKVSQRFTMAILFVACCGLVYWSWQAGISRALEIFTAILIVACPCALALAAPFTYGNASRMLSRIGVYLKNPQVMETLASASHLVFDKTGTLTSKGAGAIRYSGADLTPADIRRFASLSGSSIHPLSKALTRHWGEGPAEAMSDFREVEGQGLEGSFEGTPYYIGSWLWMKQNGLTGDSIPVIDQHASLFIGKGDRILGGYRVHNSYRSGILREVRELSSRFQVAVISGDGPSEREFLERELGRKIPVQFRQDPGDKLGYIRKLRESGTVVMFGDGINDALALKESDVGVAITEESGSFTPNSDIIFQAESLGLLPGILDYATDARRTLYACLALSLLYNGIGLAFAFSGALTPFVAAVLMPVSSVTVVLLATGMTGWFARKRKIS